MIKFKQQNSCYKDFFYVVVLKRESGFEGKKMFAQRMETHNCQAERIGTYIFYKRWRKQKYFQIFAVNRCYNIVLDK